MEYDRDDRFPFYFEQNTIKFNSKLEGKLSPRSFSMEFERKWILIFPSAEQKKA